MDKILRYENYISSQKINESNEFISDAEKILELKMCLDEVLSMMNEDEDVESAFNKSRTLIRDVLSRFEENKKFLTARDAHREGPFDFLDD